MRNFVFWDSKITADGGCSHEIKRCEPRKHIKKQRHYVANKGPFSQSYGFSSSHVWMWELNHNESWALKNWCFFEPWCRRRLLRVSWTTRRSNPSILKGISPEYSLEGLMLKLKLQYFGHLMRRTDSLEKTLMLGKIEGGRRPGFDPSVGKIPWRRKWQPTVVFLLEHSVDRGAWWATVHGVTKSRTQLSDLTFKIILLLIWTRLL